MYELLTKYGTRITVQHDGPRDIGMDITEDNGHDRQGLLNPCPNCRTNEHLRIKCDLASLNALEYWIECDECGESWTDRQLGWEYAESDSQIIEAWNTFTGDDTE